MMEEYSNTGFYEDIPCIDHAEEQFMMRVVSIQAIKKWPVIEQLVKYEVSCLSLTNSPHNVRVHTSLTESSNFLFFRTFLYRQLTVKTELHRNIEYREQTAIKWLKAVLEALEEQRKFKVYIPRVLSNECFFFNENGELVVDCYRSTFFLDSQAYEHCSPIGTEPPEVLLNNRVLSETRDEIGDVWSLGVCFFEMLTKFLPWVNFPGGLMSLQYAGFDWLNNIVFPQHVSFQTKWLIESMLVIDRKKRITWEDLLNHPVFSSGRNDSVYSNVLEPLEPYSDRSAMKSFHMGSRSEELQVSELPRLELSESMFLSSSSVIEDINILVKPGKSCVFESNSDIFSKPTIESHVFEQILIESRLNKSIVLLNRHNCHNRYIHETNYLQFCREVSGDLGYFASFFSGIHMNDLASGFSAIPPVFLQSLLRKTRSMVASLRKPQPQNIFNMPDFQEFVQTEESKTVLKELEALENDLNKSLATQTNPSETLILGNSEQALESINRRLLDLQSQLMRDWLNHKEVCKRSLDSRAVTKVRVVLGKFNCCMVPKLYFPFGDQHDVVFNWEIFRNADTTEFFVGCCSEFFRQVFDLEDSSLIESHK